MKVNLRAQKLNRLGSVRKLYLFHDRHQAQVHPSLERECSKDPCNVHLHAARLNIDALNKIPSEAMKKEAKTYKEVGNAYKTWAITKAVRSRASEPIEKRIAVVDKFVDCGASLEGALVFAAWGGHHQLVIHILDKYKGKVEVDGRVPPDNRNLDGTGNGETAFLAAVMVRDVLPGMGALLKTLVEEYGADVNAPFEDDMYGGETALHIAAVDGDMELAQYLIAKNANLEATTSADSKFFRKEDRLANPYYFGTTPLCFAAAAGNVDIVKYFTENNVKVEQTDTHDNTVFHLLAMRTDRPAFERLKVLVMLEHYVTKSTSLSINSLLSMPNEDGYTAVALCAKNGDRDFCQAMIDQSRKFKWSWGPLVCHGYPLTLLDGSIIRIKNKRMLQELSKLKSAVTKAETADDAQVKASHRIVALDDIRMDGRGRKNIVPDPSGEELHAAVAVAEKLMKKSVVDVILDQHQVKLMDVQIIREMMDDKWHSFAHKKHNINTLSYVLRIVIFCVACGLRPDTKADRTVYTKSGSDSWDGWQVLRLVCEIISVASALMFLKKEAEDMRRVGYSGYIRGRAGWPVSINVHWAGIFGGLVTRLLKSQSEDAFLSLSALAGWFYFLSFLESNHYIGPLIIMMVKMACKDLVQWCLIFVVTVVAFTFSFVTLYQHQLAEMRSELGTTEALDSHMFIDYWNAPASIFRLALAEYEYDQFDTSESNTWFTQGMFVCAILVTSVLMLNMLIAMMAMTFTDIYDNTVLQSRFARARKIAEIETEVPIQELERYNPSDEHVSTNDRDSDAANCIAADVTLRTVSDRLAAQEVSLQALAKSVSAIKDRVEHIAVDPTRSLIA